MVYNLNYDQTAEISSESETGLSGQEIIHDQQNRSNLMNQKDNFTINIPIAG